MTDCLKCSFAATKLNKYPCSECVHVIVNVFITRKENVPCQDQGTPLCLTEACVKQLRESLHLQCEKTKENQTFRRGHDTRKD